MRIFKPAMSSREPSLSSCEWDAVLNERIGLQRVGDWQFRSLDAHPWLPVGNRSVYGGTFLGWAVEAACRTVDPKFGIHSFHSKFLDRAVSEHVDLFVTNQREGRSYATRGVEARQHGRLVFTASVSFQVQEKSSFVYYAKEPDVMPYGAKEYADSRDGTSPMIVQAVLPPELGEPGFSRYEKAVRQHDKLHVRRKTMLRALDEFVALPFEYRSAVPDMTDETGHLQRGVKTAFWFRSKGPFEQPLYRQYAALAYMIDIVQLVTMVSELDPHTNQRPSMLASLDHTMWYYGSFNIRDWVLMVPENQAAASGRALVLARFYRGDGTLVAVSMQEGVFRTRDSKPGRDADRALPAAEPSEAKSRM